MNVVEVHALLMGVPLLVVLVLAALIWSHKGPHPATYKMSDPWTSEPIVWAAVDEKIGDPHHHGSDEFAVGGGASGKW